MATTSTFAPRDTPLKNPKLKNLKAESPLIIEVFQPPAQLPTPANSSRPEETSQKKENESPEQNSSPGNSPRSEETSQKERNESPEQDSSPGNSQALLPHVKSSQVVTQQILYQFLNFFARALSSQDAIFNS